MSKKGQFVCAVCGRDFVRKCNLAAHRRAVHKASSNRIVSDVAEAGGSHIEVSHGKSDVQFGCSHCGRHFKSEVVLKFHLKRVQQKQSKPVATLNDTARLHGTEHQCDRCAFTCRKFRIMEQHKSSVHGIKHYVCAHCGAAFVRRVNLTTHMEDKHEPIEVGKYKCARCSATFATRRTMQNHVRSGKCNQTAKVAGKNARSNDKIVCALCSCTFTLQRNMRRHIGTMHQDDSRFKCAACGKAFARHYMLLNHSMNCEVAGVRTESSEFKSELYVLVDDEPDIKLLVPVPPSTLSLGAGE